MCERQWVAVTGKRDGEDRKYVLEVFKTDTMEDLREALHVRFGLPLKINLHFGGSQIRCVDSGRLDSINGFHNMAEFGFTWNEEGSEALNSHVKSGEALVARRKDSVEEYTATQAQMTEPEKQAVARLTRMTRKPVWRVLKAYIESNKDETVARDTLNMEA
jgi:hypothetical protein